MHAKKRETKKKKNVRKNIKQTKKRTNEQTIKPIQYEDIIETLFLLVNQCKRGHKELQGDVPQVIQKHITQT